MHERRCPTESGAEREPHAPSIADAQACGSGGMPLSLLRRGVVWDEPRLNTQDAGRQAADFTASDMRLALAGLVAAGLQRVDPRLTLRL